MCRRCWSLVGKDTQGQIERHFPLRKGRDIPDEYAQAARIAINESWRKRGA